MTCSIRLLTADDLDAVIELQHTIKKYAGVSSDFKKKYTNYSFTNFYLNPNEPTYFMFGFFEQEKLIATIGSIDSKEVPAWTLTKFMSVPNDHQAAAALFSYMLEHQENKHLYRYWICCAESAIEAHDKQWTKLVPLRERYNKYQEYVVEPNQFTGYETIDHDILAYTRWPERLIIQTRILPNEYRTNI